MAAAKEEIDVVLGVVVHPDRRHCLLSIRLEGSHLSGYWEFPGGKVGATERFEAALVRELQEELAITVSEADCLLFNTLNHSYPERDVCLSTYIINGAVTADYLVLGKDGVGAEGQQMRWVAFDTLKEYRFPEANGPLVAALMRNQWGRR